jgi:acetyltransferase-like isoleucine patch superfamily enzyme
MANDYVCFGNFNEQAAGHSEWYFSERYTWLDFRGGLKIAATAQFGFSNRIMTASHSIATGQFYGPMVYRPVTIEDYAWITSFCILYNCTIGHHAVVSIGSVVANMVVEPYCIVEGNPAQVVKVWNAEIRKWVRV